MCVFLVLAVQHAIRMRHIVICGLPYSAIFFHIINGTIFEKVIESKVYVCCFSLQRLYETFLILRRIERNMIQNVYWSSCKVLGILFRF